jgi:hypothetical protein
VGKITFIVHILCCCGVGRMICSQQMNFRWERMNVLQNGRSRLLYATPTARGMQNTNTTAASTDLWMESKFGPLSSTFPGGPVHAIKHCGTMQIFSRSIQRIGISNSLTGHGAKPLSICQQVQVWTSSTTIHNFRELWSCPHSIRGTVPSQAFVMSNGRETC